MTIKGKSDHYHLSAWQLSGNLRSDINTHSNWFNSKYNYLKPNKHLINFQ